MTENGKTRRVPAVEVMLRRLANDADARRDPRAALTLLLPLIDSYADVAGRLELGHRGASPG